MTTIEKNTCRLCFTTTDSFVEIFSETNSDGLTSVGRMIVECLLSELKPNTGHPEIVCQLCHLQLNVFFEFKKKVFLNQDKFEIILNKTKKLTNKCEKSASAGVNKSPIQKTIDSTTLQKRLTRSSFIQSKESNSIDLLSSNVIVSDLSVSKDPVKSEIHSIVGKECEFKRKIDESDFYDNDNDNDGEQAKYIKLEEYEIEEIYREDSENQDETEQYLEEQYLENFSETEEPTEIEYIFEDEIDDENCNSFKEEHLKSESNITEGTKKRKPKTPRVKKFLTERVLCADTMKEYDAVKCLNCNEYFETMDKFTVHHKECDKVPCKVCGKMLSSNGMDLHMKQHDSEKPFTCSICAKGFTTSQQCADHEFRHQNQRPYGCHLCKKSFKMKCDLRTHIMCHQDIRKHACPICEKAFRQLSHLRNHIETHSSENSYKCEVCERTFKTKVTMQNHVKQMHTEQHEFECEICKRGFYRRNRLERHRKTHFKKPKQLMELDNLSKEELEEITEN